jgi:hypothetical protein
LNILNVPVLQPPFQCLYGRGIFANEPVAVEKEVALAIVDVSLDCVVDEHGEKLIVDESSVVVPKQMFSPFLDRPGSPFHIVQITDPARE